MEETATKAWGMREGARKRVARVYTNETCNQGCAFCNTRRPREDRAFIHPQAVRRRLDQAVQEGSTVVLTGGEPTMRRDLAALVEHAVSRGARVELETNGTLIDVIRAEQLAASGLALARVHLPIWGDACDALTRDPGGFEKARAGARALERAGVKLEISSPVVASNRHTLPALPKQLAQSGLSFEALVLTVPVQGPQDVLPLDEAAAVIESVDTAARHASVTLRLDPSTHVPPCLYAHPNRVAHLYSMTRGGRRRPGYAQRAVCESCVAADRCPGLPEDSPIEPTPLRDDSVRRRLSVISTVAEQIERELFQDEINRVPGEAPHRMRTVRTNFRCNQVCRFCFVSTHLPTAPEEKIRAAISEAAAAGHAIVLSGGEPTLEPRLGSYVQLAKERGARAVEVQTNATRLADEHESTTRAASLVARGVDRFFISLHGSHAELSDRVTGAPGTYDKTVRGIDAAHETTADVTVNFVFCEANYRDFPAYIELVGRRWPRARACVSFVAPSTDMVPRSADLIPRYSDVIPHLADGLRRADELDVAVSGFDSLCGIPLCLVPTDLARFVEVGEAAASVTAGEAIYVEACSACALRTRCFGLRQGYAELHGTSELRPVSADDLS